MTKIQNLLGMLIISSIICLGCDTTENSSADSYYPLAKGNSWTYKLINEGSTGTEEVVTSVDDETGTYKGKTYHRLTSRFKVADSISYEWLANAGSAYYVRELNPGVDFKDSSANENIYLDESKAVGEKIKIFENKNGPATSSGILEVIGKALTRKVNGKTYSNVIHARRTITIGAQIPNMGDILGDSSLDVKGLDMGGVNMAIIANLYYAKGVGLIEQDISMNGAPVAKQTILSYKVN